MSITTFQHYRTILESVIEKRPWIVAVDVLVGAGALAETLLDHGAERVLAIGASRGAGNLPSPERVSQILLDCADSPDMMTAIRTAQAALANVGPEVQAKVDAFDPERAARVVGAIFCNADPVARRSIYGGRHDSWYALEDKTLVDAVWDAVGIPRAPCEIVPAELESLRAAAERIGSGGEVVLVGDDRGGFNGGAQYVRWIRSERHLLEAADFYARECDQVRVMPFLEGIPCSVHGIVFPDYVVALRPCEMLVFRDPEAGRFVYAAAATFWEAPDAARDEMRQAAKRTGAYLRDLLGYRGVFTIDGVLTSDGFRPTELNPRFGAAINTMTRTMQDFSLYLLHLAIAEGEELDYRPRDLERLLIEYAETHRAGFANQMTKRSIQEQVDGALVITEDEVRHALPGEDSDASYMLGPSPMGGFLRMTLDPERTPYGPSSAARVARAMRFIGDQLDLDYPPMEVARDPS